MDSPLEYFVRLADPRIERNREHLLEKILLIAIAAVLSGAESWNDIEDHGQSKQEWLKTFLTLPAGIPSHGTFNRVFAALDPEELEQGFAAWVASIAQLTAGEVVAIDGKTLCGSRQGGKKQLVHMVSAWASANKLVLGQRKADDKSNEITAIPKLWLVIVPGYGHYNLLASPDIPQIVSLCKRRAMPFGVTPVFTSESSDSWAYANAIFTFSRWHAIKRDLIRMATSSRCGWAAVSTRTGSPSTSKLLAGCGSSYCWNIVAYGALTDRECKFKG